MLENLKRHYKDALILGDLPIQTDTYLWFITETGAYFGIKKDHLTSQEVTLLSSLFTPYGKNNQEMSDIQLYWYNLLFLNQLNMKSPQTFSHCRLIHIHANQPITDKHEFQEAIVSVLSRETTFLWENEYTGLIIEHRNDETVDEVSFEELVVTLTSDFYADFHLFVGQVHSITQQLHDTFRTEKELFQKGMHYLYQTKVYYTHDILPYLFLEKMDSPLRNTLVNVIPEDIQNDDELLENIKVFLESNLNVSNASKRLYMHRNSLQYRIDKFIEKSGIDIKHFQGAVTTYLAILTLEHFTDS
ncbi:PucR family transcriptional regulator [Fredinandcohnia sp. 179-A 10B2 NHS]|uniref:PucR family transcriptional regulator n=1 Tax=Fredinandcohnia sp. 179-A 10B2 NHS TaxID=3235176 RepID=UPI0039A26138